MPICQSTPRLCRGCAYDFPATVFVATQPVDRNHPGYMSWDQLREIQTSKFGIGSQTRTHPHMHMITPEQVEEELRISNDRFIAELEFALICLPIPMASTT